MIKALKNSPARFVFILLALLSGLMHLPHMHKDIMSVHAWRQAQTQSTIQNFYEEDMNILNPRRNDRGNGDGIYRMEFPLMQWLVASIYKLTAPEILITRLCMFVIGLLSVFGFYKMLLAVFKHQLPAIMGAWAFNFSPCFYYYTINPLPDNLALCCSVWGMALLLKWYRQSDFYLLPLSGFFLALGALCKLPFILFFIVPFMIWIQRGKSMGWVRDRFLEAVGHFAFVLLPLAWYAWVIPSWKGNAIVGGAFQHQVDWNTWFGYLAKNLVTVFPEMIINYAALPFFIFGLYSLFRNKLSQRPLFPAMLAWFVAIIAYFLFELNVITSVHDYYLFPFFPVLFTIVAYGAYSMFMDQRKWVKTLSLVLLLALPLTAYLRMQVRWNPEKPGFNRDLLFYKADLRAAVPDDALVVAGNDISHHIMFYYIDKKGWGFDNNRLDSTSLQSMIDAGASFLYSDSRDLDHQPSIASLLDTMILERGTVRVYQLKKGSALLKE